MPYISTVERLGIEKGLQQVALNMLNQGLDIQLVASVTNLDENELRQLKEQISR